MLPAAPMNALHQQPRLNMLLGITYLLHTEHRHHLGIRDASWVRAVDSVDKLQTVQVWLTVQINQT